MSQSHIPQPDASSPGEQIQSTDQVVPLQSIEVTQPSLSQEIVPALGEFNQIDPFFYQQFRQIAKIRWTTQDVAGKLLWYVPINPLSMDKNLAYLCQMYLAWDGDFIFNFKVAGTGFHAGLLTFVKTPPTIHPTQLTNPIDFTYMPWDAVDPKMLEIGSLYGRDIRPIKYHYMKKQDNAPPDYYLGGYFALFVDIPLNTSASGTPRIEIAIWMKCAPNFKVSWMVPFDLQKLDTQSIAPAELMYNLSFNQLIAENIASFPAPATKLLILPKLTKVLTTGIYACYTLNGSELSQWESPNINQTVIKAKLQSAKSKPGDKMIMYDCDPFYQGCMTGKFSVCPMNNDYTWQMIDSVYKFEPTFERGIEATVKMWGGTSIPADDSPVEISINPDKVKPSDIVDNEIAALTGTESFLVFASGPNNCTSVQTFGLSRYFRTGVLSSWIPSGLCAIFELGDSNTELPLTYVKLYRKGFFTAPATDNQIEFLFPAMYMKFLFFLPETDPIPAGTAAMNNTYFWTAYNHRKIFKRERKAISQKASASN